MGEELYAVRNPRPKIRLTSYSSLGKVLIVAPFYN